MLAGGPLMLYKLNKFFSISTIWTPNLYSLSKQFTSNLGVTSSVLSVPEIGWVFFLSFESLEFSLSLIILFFSSTECTARCWPKTKVWNRQCLLIFVSVKRFLLRVRRCWPRISVLTWKLICHLKNVLKCI